MAKTAQRATVAPQVLEAIRIGEADKRWLQDHLEVLEPYRGQWVVVWQQQVIAHSANWRDTLGAGDPRRHPGALTLYVPTQEEAQAVRI